MKKLTIILFILAFALTLDATLSGYKICVDPGHGGSDPGATGINGATYPDEADLNLDIDLRFRTLLTNDAASVLMTRDADTDVSLANRVDQANAWGATIFFSTHLNSADAESASGTETYAYQSGTTSDTIAGIVQEELLSHMGRVDRGVKYENFYVIRYTTMPAILSEGVFVSNQSDFDYITADSGKAAHALALYHAVCGHFGTTPLDGGGTDPGAVKGFVYNLTTGLGNVEGNRIADATVTITPTTGSPDSLTTPATGLFVFASVEPGDYTLTVEKSGFTTAEKNITVVSGADTWASTGIEEEGAVTDTEPQPDDTVADDTQPDETMVDEDQSDPTDQSDPSDPSDQMILPDDDTVLPVDEPVTTDTTETPDEDKMLPPLDKDYAGEPTDSDLIIDDPADGDNGCSCSLVL